MSHKPIDEVDEEGRRLLWLEDMPMIFSESHIRSGTIIWKFIFNSSREYLSMSENLSKLIIANQDDHGWSYIWLKCLVLYHRCDSIETSN